MATIGRSKRKYQYEQKTQLPGVGDYNMESNELRRTKGGTFTRAIRSITEATPAEFSKTQNRSFSLRPGPGSYSLQLTRLKQPISFTHSRRFLTDKSKEIPGPGAYNCDSSSKEKIKWGIISRSNRSSLLSKEKVPGPCDYTVPDISSYKKKQPVVRIGKAKRDLNDGLDILTRYNHSKEKEGGVGSEAGGPRQQQLSERRNLKMERAWHGKKIQKQARRVQKDQAQAQV